MGWVLDLDGVVWLDHEPVPGAAEAVRRLREDSHPLLFVTNNAEHTPATVAGHLGAVGIPATTEEVLTSAMAAATLVAEGERVLAFAGPGVLEALRMQGAEVASAAAPGRGRFDTVVVGRHVDVTFASLCAAVRAVADGARLVATNTDPAYPTPSGPEPGAGALLAAVETASGQRAAVVAGKPHAPLAALVEERLDRVGWVVGDSPATDGALARRLGARFGLVLSGVTSPSQQPVDPAPDAVAADLGSLVESVLTAGAAAP